MADCEPDSASTCDVNEREKPCATCKINRSWDSKTADPELLRLIGDGSEDSLAAAGLVAFHGAHSAAGSSDAHIPKWPKNMFVMGKPEASSKRSCCSCRQVICTACALGPSRIGFVKPWGPGGKGGTQSKLATHSKHHHPVDHGEFLSTGCPDEPPASHTCSADRLPISKSMSRKRPSEAPLMTLEADRDQQLLPDRGGHGASHRSLTRLRLLGCVFEIRACIPAETICHDCCIAATLCGTPDAAGTVTGIPVLLSRDIRVAAVCALANPPTLVESLSGTLMPLPRGWSASLPLLVKDLLGSSQTALVSRTITPDFISKTWLSLLCKLLFGKDMLMLRNEAEGSVPGCVTDVCMPLDESTSPLLQKQGFVQGFLALSLPCILDQPVREDAAAESTRVLASWEVVCVVVPAPSPECPHETSSHALRVHVHVPAVVEPEHANSVAVASSAVNGVPTMLMSLIQQLQYVARSLPAKQVVHVQTLSVSLAWAINTTQRLCALQLSEEASCRIESVQAVQPVLVAHPVFCGVLDDALMSAVMVAPTPVLNCLAVLQQAVSAVPTPVQEICMAAGCESLDGCNFSFRLHQHGGGIKPLLRALLFLESLQQRLQSCPPLKHALVMALKTHIVALRSFPRDSFTDRRVLPAQCFLALLDNGHGDNEAATAYQCSSTIIIWEKMLCPLWSCLRPFWQLMMSPDAVSLSALLPYMLAATAGDWHDAAATHSRYSSIATDVCHLFHAWPGLQFVATNGGLGLHPLVTCTSSSNMEHRSSREVGSSTVNDVRVIAATTLACAFDECVSISSDSDDEHEENHKFVAFEHADHSSAKLKLVDAGDLFFVLQEFDARWLQQTSRPSHNVFKDVFPCMRAAMHADCTASAGARAKCTQQLKASLLPGTLPGLEAAVLKYVDTFTNRVSDEFITDLSFQSLQTASPSTLRSKLQQLIFGSAGRASRFTPKQTSGRLQRCINVMLWLFHIDPVLLALHGHNVLLMENAGVDATASPVSHSAAIPATDTGRTSHEALDQTMSSSSLDSTPMLASVFPFVAAAFASPPSSQIISIPGMSTISPEHPCFHGLFGDLFSKLRNYTFQTATWMSRSRAVTVALKSPSSRTNTATVASFNDVLAMKLHETIRRGTASTSVKFLAPPAARPLASTSSGGKCTPYSACAALDAWNASVSQLQTHLNLHVQGSDGNVLSPQVQLLNNQSQLVQAASALLRSLYLIKLNTRGSPPTVSSAGMLTFQQAESCTSMAFPFHLMTASCSDLKLPVFSLHDSDGGSLGVACIPLLHQRLRESNLISTKHTLAYPTPESSATEGPLCSAFLDSAMQRLATLNISHKVACFRFESKGDTTGFIPTTASTLGSDIFPYILAGPPALACIVLQENFDRFIVPLQAGYVLPASQYNKRAKATCEENVEGTPVSLTRFC